MDRHGRSEVPCADTERETEKYVVVYEQSPNNWGAYIPDVPGCVAVGDTRAETEKLIKEALEFHLEGLEDGDPIPPPGTWTGVVEVEVPRTDVTRTETGEPRPRRKRGSA